MPIPIREQLDHDSSMRARAWLVTMCLLTGVAADAGELMPVARAQMCVTEGAIEPAGARSAGESRWSVSVPKMRAYLNVKTAAIVEARFRYLGSTGDEARLGSGELRRQFGLKLRAQDACNLVYAMWRIEPESKLVVSVKSNPGQHSSAECGNRGYRNIKPSRSEPVPVLSPGAEHSLRAEMSGERLRVFADNALVWDGSVGAEGLEFDGPVGIRSDNAHLELELRTGPLLNASSAQPPACRTGADQAE
jgi:hypothetical protein